MLSLGAWVTGRPDSSAVEAAKVVEADGEHVAEHADGVAERVDAAAGSIRPGDRHLADAVAELAGQVQDFDVEAEAGDLLSPEDILGGGAGERLEPALGVLDAPDGQRLHQQVEDPPHEVPDVRLARAPGAGALAAGDHDLVPRVKALGQPYHFLDRGAQVG